MNPPINNLTNLLFQPPPKTNTIAAKYIQHRSGDTSFSQHLIRKKKRTATGQRVLRAERQITSIHLSNARMANVDQELNTLLQRKNLLWDFYYSNATIRRTRKQNQPRRRYLDILCCTVRQFVNGKNQRGPAQRKRAVVLFIGNRDYRTDSRIKGFVKYEGKWKPAIHARYTTTLIANEHNTFQTGVYYFQKTTHPIQVINGKLKTIKGTNVCTNPQCVLVQENKPHQTRDSISSLAIGLTGLHEATFGHLLDPFDPKDISPLHTDSTRNGAANSFCARSVEWLEFDELET